VENNSRAIAMRFELPFKAASSDTDDSSGIGLYLDVVFLELMFGDITKRYNTLASKWCWN
jgi:hypothetical protein